MTWPLLDALAIPLLVAVTVILFGWERFSKRRSAQ